MGCVYFVRHGQTVWNVENKICGATDIALTDMGHQQAMETGKRILEEGIQADEILFCILRWCELQILPDISRRSREFLPGLSRD